MGQNSGGELQTVIYELQTINEVFNDRMRFFRATGLYATYYNRAIETQMTVPVGRKSAPATKAEIDFMKFREPSA